MPLWDDDMTLIHSLKFEDMFIHCSLCYIFITNRYVSVTCGHLLSNGGLIW